MKMITEPSSTLAALETELNTGEADEYRPIADIVEELDDVDLEARETDAALRRILSALTA